MAIGASTNAERTRVTNMSRSRSGLCDQAAKAPLAPAKFNDYRFERATIKIRPIAGHENQFAIGRLPKQKIRQPLLAAGPDDEVRIGYIGRVEETGETV